MIRRDDTDHGLAKDETSARVFSPFLTIQVGLDPLERGLDVVLHQLFSLLGVPIPDNPKHLPMLRTYAGPVIIVSLLPIKQE